MKSVINCFIKTYSLKNRDPLHPPATADDINNMTGKKGIGYRLQDVRIHHTGMIMGVEDAKITAGIFYTLLKWVN
jgi:hypothetical protein